MKKYVRKISAVVIAIMVVALLGTRVEAWQKGPSLAGTEWVLYQFEVGELTFSIGDNISGRILSEDMCTSKFLNEEDVLFSCSLIGYEPTAGKFVSYGDNKYALWVEEPGAYEEAEVQCAIDGDYIKVMVRMDDSIQRKITLRKTNAPTPTPTPTPTPKKESKKEINATVDKDTFKSEAPAKTVMSTDTMGADKFLDLKIHAADDTTKTNQNFLAQALVGTNVKILLTENIYPRRDLSIAENGSLQTLTWNNLPKNQAGPVYAVVYNQIDGAYEINGILDANGTATFTGFKLRPASTITICK